MISFHAQVSRVVEERGRSADEAVNGIEGALQFKEAVVIPGNKNLVCRIYFQTFAEDAIDAWEEFGQAVMSHKPRAL
jgi:hypothetical protein